MKDEEEVQKKMLCGGIIFCAVFADG